MDITQASEIAQKAVQAEAAASAARIIDSPYEDIDSEDGWRTAPS